jgi:hypothetical protein
MNDVYEVKETPYEAVESKHFSTVDTFDLYQVHIEDTQLRSAEINLLKQSECNRLPLSPLYILSHDIYCAYFCVSLFSSPFTFFFPYFPIG